jgi:hypothetical protein
MVWRCRWVARPAAERVAAMRPAAMRLQVARPTAQRPRRCDLHRRGRHGPRWRGARSAEVAAAVEVAVAVGDDDDGTARRLRAPVEGRGSTRSTRGSGSWWWVWGLCGAQHTFALSPAMPTVRSIRERVDGVDDGVRRQHADDLHSTTRSASPAALSHATQAQPALRQSVDVAHGAAGGPTLWTASPETC